MKNILLVGAGNMGGAIGKALLSTGFVAPENFSVVNPSSEKLEFFAQKGCKISSSPENFLQTADIIILGTKPQILRNFLEEMKTKKLFAPHQILLSIAAGVPVSDIQQSSGIQKIVRVMPNTPLLVEKGVSGYYFSPEIFEEERQKISEMIKCFGLAIECETEEKINAITALSGSGPAYFFRILESMSQQAEAFGFSQKEAEEISLHTLLGAGFLAENAPENFAALREKVTSKGGTTEAALTFFENNNLSGIFQKGMVAAKNRAEAL